MKLITLIISLVFSFPIMGQNVGISTTTPHPSAALDISDSNRGLLIPRVDTADITSPATGLLVYQFSDLGFYQYNGSAWQLIGNVSDRIADTDDDTKIEVEQSPDEDHIRFYTEGTEVLRQNGSTLEMPNSGKSVFIGEEAGLQDDLTDNNNVFVGYRAGKENQTGINNVAIGEQALQNSTTGSNNVAIGKQAMSLNSGSNNVGVGLNALQKNTSGQKNTAIGGFSGFTNQAGDRNTLVGYEAGRGTATDVSGNVMLGHQAGKNETESDKLYIANTDTDAPLLYGDFATKNLTVNDSLNVANHLSIGNMATTQKESAEVAGAIQIGNAASDNPSLNDAGTMRWNETENDYEGWDGAQWLSMTMPNEEIDCEIGTEIDTLPYVITEPGYYYLTKNLELNVSGSHGVSITSIVNVTIDLNGFTITGPGNTGQSNHSGVFLDEATEITIKNGAFRNWQECGIRALNNATGQTYLHEINTSNNGTGIELNGEGSIIIHCQSSNNLNEGFEIGSLTLLKSCHAFDNGSSGFDVGFLNIIENCFSINNALDGFKGSSQSTLTKCSASGNTSDGFDFNSDNNFNSCSANGNSSVGIRCENGNNISNSLVRSNQGTGIDVSDQNIIRSNIIALNNGSLNDVFAGLRIVDGNKVINNVISANFGTGIRIALFNNMLEGNDVTRTGSSLSNDRIGYDFSFNLNAWRNNTGASNPGGNVSGNQPPTSRSLNNWMY